MVNWYKTEFGTFSVVVDSNVLEAVAPFGSATILILPDGTETTEGAAFRAVMPCTDCAFALAKSSVPYDTNVYNRFLSFFPITVLRDVMVDIGESFTDPYPIQTDAAHIINVTISVAASSLAAANLSITNALKYGAIDQEFAAAFPYGNLTCATRSSLIPDFLRAGILVANDDLTEFRSLFFTVDRYGQMRLTNNNAFNAADNAALSTFFTGLDPAYETDDPYEDIPESEPGGNGDGTFDFSSTPIDFQGLPGIGAMDTGMIDLYVPSAAQLRALSNYLWAGAFDPDNFKKLLADPMDAIIGLSIVPVSATEIGTAAATLAVGNISTGLSMPKALNQYVTVDCGSVSVLPKYGAYLDFAPNSKLQLFLPYIGYVPISPDDCMNGTISVRYSVDILGGTCIAQVKCNDHVLYEFSGQCSCSCPVTAGQYQNIALTALKLAGSVAGIAAGGAAGIATGLEDAANSIISSAKPEVQRSGGFGGSSGLMGHQVPYLILTIPKMARPGQQNTQMGYPSFVTKTLGDLEGYVEVDTIHLAGVPATDAEQAEIVDLLRGGVYV